MSEIRRKLVATHREGVCKGKAYCRVAACIISFKCAIDGCRWSKRMDEVIGTAVDKKKEIYSMWDTHAANVHNRPIPGWVREPSKRFASLDSAIALKRRQDRLSEKGKKKVARTSSDRTVTVTSSDEEGEEKGEEEDIEKKASEDIEEHTAPPVTQAGVPKNVGTSKDVGQSSKDEDKVSFFLWLQFQASGQRSLIHLESDVTSEFVSL